MCELLGAELLDINSICCERLNTCQHD